MLQVDMGPAQYRQKTIVGGPVVAASALCLNAPRDRNIMIVEQSVYDALPSHTKANIAIHKVPEGEMGKARDLIISAYRVEPLNSHWRIK